MFTACHNTGPSWVHQPWRENMKLLTSKQRSGWHRKLRSATSDFSNVRRPSGLSFQRDLFNRRIAPWCCCLTSNQTLLAYDQSRARLIAVVQRSCQLGEFFDRQGVRRLCRFCCVARGVAVAWSLVWRFWYFNTCSWYDCFYFSQPCLAAVVIYIS